MAVEKAQEIAPLLGRERRVHSHSSSKPNATVEQTNALGEVNHHVPQVVHRLGTRR
jgi:hypothetical protein